MRGILLKYFIFVHKVAVGCAGSIRDKSCTNKLFILLAFAAFPCAVFGNDGGLGCIKDLGLPRYTHVARRSVNGGTVEALINIGRSGKVGSIEIRDDADADLSAEVRDFLTLETVYSEACEGKQVQIIFTFTLTDTPEGNPPVWVRFQPPNHFFIISRPKKPNFN